MAWGAGLSWAGKAELGAMRISRRPQSGRSRAWTWASFAREHPAAFGDGVSLGGQEVAELG